MFTQDVRFEGFTTEDWSRLLSLWKSTREVPEAESRPRGGLIAIHAEGPAKEALARRSGAHRPEPRAVAGAAVRAGPAPWRPLGAFARAADGLQDLSERFGARTKQGDDFTTHLKLLLDIARELSVEGTLQLWPNHLERFALPSQPFFGNTLGTVYPNGHLVMFVLFHEGELWTSVALERSGVGHAHRRPRRAEEAGRLSIG